MSLYTGHTRKYNEFHLLCVVNYKFMFSKLYLQSINIHVDSSIRMGSCWHVDIVLTINSDSTLYEEDVKRRRNSLILSPVLP